MLRNYLIIAVRNLMKQKIFTFINIFGLAVGVACCIILGLYLRHEWRYESHHPKAERIYRVIRETVDETGNRFMRWTSGALSQVIHAEIPGIQRSIRVQTSPWLRTWMSANGQEFYQQVCLADPEILEVFDLPLLRGDRGSALTTPNGVLITESVSQKYFGDMDPMGKTIQGEGTHTGTFIITGVLKNLPETSLVQFDFLTSTIPDWGPTHWLRKHWEQWHLRPNITQIFLVLNPTTRPEDVEQKLRTLLPRYVGDESRDKFRYHLQPLLRIHLFAGQDYGSPNLSDTKGDIRRLYVAALLGLFILLLAGVNFVNLATARSSVRAKEVGLRKVVGAQRSQIVGQFLGESILLSLLAHLLALGLVQLSLPWVTWCLGITLSLGQAGLWLLLLPGSVLLIGLLAGGYPALFISKFRPISALQSNSGRKTGTLSLRRRLVLFQFSISTLMLVSTWVVHCQWKFMVRKDLGFNKENIVILPIFERDGSLFRRRYEIRQRFLEHPDVRYASMTNNVPLHGGGHLTIRPEGEHRELNGAVFDLDEDLLEVFGIELIQGRNFSNDIHSDAQGAYILNETAVKTLGWKDPIGKTLLLGGKKNPGTVIGVVKDFHYDWLYQKIEPLVLRHQGGVQHLCLRVDSRDLPSLIDFFKQTWIDLISDRPFDYYFFDQKLEAAYNKSMKTGQMFSVGTGIAIFIGCLGLVGLVALSTERRTKEIGIRKVLGATRMGIVALFTRDLVRIVMIANLLMLPASVYLSHMWLAEYPYRVELGPWPYVFTAGLLLIIASLTVCLTAFRAATKNPVDALRHE